MTIRIKAGEVRSAWDLGAKEARTDLGNTSTDLTDAQGTSMGDLADDLTYAVERLRGVTTTTNRVVDSFKTNVEACITTYETTDQASAGAFTTLMRPQP
ncbi:hypothetical protein ACOCJ7_09480 [Knoellia sp. CPCC 206453]|uniref:hypothetical protein n=1 Tax=Knoellia pratensis TaxID=3404796 RepID=UPI00361CDB6A